MLKQTVPREAILDEEELGQCGAGSSCTCYALIMDPNNGRGICGFVINPLEARRSGRRLKWRRPSLCVKDKLPDTPKG